jgi:ComF family protein
MSSLAGTFIDLCAAFGRRLADVAVPPLCPLCRTELRSAPCRLCTNCEQELPALPERRCHGCGGGNDSYLDLCRDCLLCGGRPWTAAVSAFPFAGQLREAVHAFKYQRQTSLAPFFAAAMADAWRRYAPAGAAPDLIVPVPLHWLREISRGYNQAALLASFLGRELQCPADSVLRRRRRTSQQARLRVEQRLRNTRGAFMVRRSNIIVGKTLLLVDDVFTTGATLSAATTALLAAGAAAVYVASAARD